MAKPALTEQDWTESAKALGVDVAAIKAVDEIESLGSGFYANDEPKLLFERHKFSRHTSGKFDKSHPDISNPKPGGYGPSSTQHKRMQRAAALNREAALMSASWGRFQILGENYEQAGFADLQSFVNAMYKSERAQLKAFVAFILADPRLARALRAHDWETFARIYNGPAYAAHDYDGRLAAAHKRIARGVA